MYMVLTTTELYNKLELKNQEIILLSSLLEYYNNNKYFNILIDIINGDNKISKRTIEYFVTQYSIQNKIIYNYENSGEQSRFNVHNSYKNQLKAYKKKYFDPFGRGDRIPFIVNDHCIITTIGQLNFYKWFFSKKIYDYCYDNYTNIQNSLLSIKKPFVKKQKNTKPNKPINAYKSNINNNGRIMISFSL